MVQAVVQLIGPRKTQLVFPRVRKCSVVWTSPPSRVCVTRAAPLGCIVSASVTKCLGVGRSIPKPAGGGSVVPKLSSSLLLDVSNCECHISNDVAFE